MCNRWHDGELPGVLGHKSGIGLKSRAHVLQPPGQHRDPTSSLLRAGGSLGASPLPPHLQESGSCHQPVSPLTGKEGKQNFGVCFEQWLSLRQFQRLEWEFNVWPCAGGFCLCVAGNLFHRDSSKTLINAFSEGFRSFLLTGKGSLNTD